LEDELHTTRLNKELPLLVVVRAQVILPLDKFEAY
jgi:hypothetical protein